MRAAPHLLNRLRRWLALQGLDLRARQLAVHIQSLEAEACADQHALAQLRAELIATQRRLAAARLVLRARPGRRTARVTTGD